MSNIANENFTGGNGTELTTFNSAWVRVYPVENAQIYDGRLCTVATSGGNARYRHTTTPLSADYEVACDLYVAGTTSTAYSAGPMARCVASTSQLTCYWARYRRGTGIQLFRYNNSTATQLGTTISASWAINTTVRLRLKVEGAVISVYLDASTTPIISVTDTSPIVDAGFTGLISASPATDGVHIDNWSADTLGSVSDTTAPILTTPSATATSTTTASGSVMTDEANGTLYWACNTSATATLVEVKAGSSQAVVATGSQSVSVTSLTASITYYLHFAHTDAAANDSNVVTSASFTTPSTTDTTPPTLTGAITVSAITASSYTLSWPTGSDDVAVTAYEYSINGGSWTENGVSTTVNITGRTPGATDLVQVRAKDAAGNVSSPVLSTSVTLASDTYPSITAPVLKNNTGTVLAGETGVIVNVYNATTGALVLHKTGLSSDASGVVSFSDAALSAATSYAYEVVLSGGRRRLPLVTTA